MASNDPCHLPIPPVLSLQWLQMCQGLNIVILVLLYYVHALQIMNYMNSPSYNPPATSTWAEPSCRSQLGQSSPYQLEELRANLPKQVPHIAQVHTHDMVPGWTKGFQMLHLTLEEWCFPGIVSLQWAVSLCFMGGTRRPERGNPGNSRFPQSMLKSSAGQDRHHDLDLTVEMRNPFISQHNSSSPWVPMMTVSEDISTDDCHFVTLNAKPCLGC